MNKLAAWRMATLAAAALAACGDGGDGGGGGGSGPPPAAASSITLGGTAARGEARGLPLLPGRLRGGGQHIALAIARLLRLEGLSDPIETFIIDAKGLIHEKVTGMVSFDGLSRSLEALL